MKKFFSVIPLQQNLTPYVYEPIGNSQLGMKEATCFPIVPTIRGYVESGEEFRVIAVMTDNEACKRNLETLKREVRQICAVTGAVCPRDVEAVLMPENQQVSIHVDTFQKLISYVEDNDELFACMTFGTKPTSRALMMAVQYAYRVKRNTSISCIVYGEIKRSKNPDTGEIEGTGKVYDMTALIHLDEVVRMLAERGVEHPEEAIGGLLSL